MGWNLDGSRLLSAGDATSVLIYDTARLEASMRPERNFTHECRGHTKNIEVLISSTTSPDMFITGGLDSLINVYDIRTGTRPIASIKTDSKCLFVDWAPDGNTVAVGVASNTVYFVDCLTWTVKLKKTFEGEVNQFRWSNDGKRVYFTRGDGSVDTYLWPSFDHLLTFRGNAETAMGIACDPQNRFVAVSGLDCCVSVWDALSLSNIVTIDRGENPVQAVEYCADGNYMALIGDYERIEIVDSVSGGLVYSISTPGMLNNISWHPKRFLLAYAPIGGGKGGRYGGNEMGPATYVWGFPRK